MINAARLAMRPIIPATAPTTFKTTDQSGSAGGGGTVALEKEVFVRPDMLGAKCWASAMPRDKNRPAHWLQAYD